MRNDTVSIKLAQVRYLSQQLELISKIVWGFDNTTTLQDYIYAGKIPSKRSKGRHIHQLHYSFDTTAYRCTHVRKNTRRTVQSLPKMNGLCCLTYKWTGLRSASRIAFVFWKCVQSPYMPSMQLRRRAISDSITSCRRNRSATSFFSI